MPESTLSETIHEAFDESPAPTPDATTIKEDVAELHEMKVRDESAILNSIVSRRGGDDTEAVFDAYQTLTSENSESESTGNNVGDSPGDESKIQIPAFGSHVGEWIDVDVGIVKIWKDNRDSLSAFDTIDAYEAADAEGVAFAGLVADGTGEVAKLLVWGKSYVSETDLMPADIGKGDYITIENVPINEDDGYEIQVNSASSIHHLPNPSFEIDSDEFDSGVSSFTGCIVGIGSRSGFIERCPESGCSRTVNKNRCSKHGDVDGEDDLRLKLKVDDGNVCITAYANQPQTEAITGIDMDEAREMALDALDRDVVIEEMKDTLIHRTVELEGGWISDTEFNITDIQFAGEYRPDLNDILIDARSLKTSA